MACGRQPVGIGVAVGVDHLSVLAVHHFPHGGRPRVPRHGAPVPGKPRGVRTVGYGAHLQVVNHHVAHPLVHAADDDVLHTRRRHRGLKQVPVLRSHGRSHRHMLRSKEEQCASHRVGRGVDKHAHPRFRADAAAVHPLHPQAHGVSVGCRDVNQRAHQRHPVGVRAAVGVGQLGATQAAVMAVALAPLLAAALVQVGCLPAGRGQATVAPYRLKTLFVGLAAAHRYGVAHRAGEVVGASRLGLAVRADGACAQPVVVHRGVGPCVAPQVRALARGGVGQAHGHGLVGRHRHGSVAELHVAARRQHQLECILVGVMVQGIPFHLDRVAHHAIHYRRRVYPRVVVAVCQLRKGGKYAAPGCQGQTLFGGHIQRGALRYRVHAEGKVERQRDGGHPGTLLRRAPCRTAPAAEGGVGVDVAPYAIRRQSDGALSAGRNPCPDQGQDH